ncbi:MAG: divalent-cation tolerance protein CutA [Chloroflexota bacterium]
MNEAKHAVVLITVSGAEEARKVAGVLLEQRQAACVNIVPGVSSRYWWEGKLEDATESLLIVKTRADAVPEVVRLVKETHSYSVPEIIALPVIGGNPDYLDWLDRETGQGGGGHQR